jgi:hypothetical protein
MQQKGREEERLRWGGGDSILNTEQMSVTPEVPDTGFNSLCCCDHFTASG